MKKKLDVFYFSLFSLSDRALKCKPDTKYTQSTIENILFFAWCDGLIDGHQYEEMTKLLEKDLEEFKSYVLENIDFN